MAFVDEMTVKANAGKGGDGVVRWLHLKGKEFGGPSGGNGGRGGDIIIRGVRDLNRLVRYKGVSEFSAENGADGFRNDMEGRNGTHTYIDVPVGSRVVHKESGREWDLLTEGEEYIVFEGGRGGFGNSHFKSSTNQRPEQFSEGKPAEEGTLFIEVRLIADVGFIGFPNAGKSSLLNAFTKKKTKVAAYEFTTLEPNLGVLYNYVLADIPGLIEGASSGKGLGHAFLRHVRRTRVLLHCVSTEHEDVVSAYKTIRDELLQYDEVLTQKPEIVFLTKIDEVSESEYKEKEKELKALGLTVIVVSILDDTLVKGAQDALITFLENLA